MYRVIREKLPPMTMWITMRLGRHNRYFSRFKSKPPKRYPKKTVQGITIMLRILRVNLIMLRNNNILPSITNTLLLPSAMLVIRRLRSAV